MHALTLSLLLLVVVALLIAALCIWLVDLIGLPYPANVILKVGVAIVALIVIVRATGLA